MSSYLNFSMYSYIISKKYSRLKLQVSVNENIEKVGKLMNSKKLQLQVVTMELQKRMAAIMEAQQQQAKS